MASSGVGTNGVKEEASAAGTGILNKLSELMEAPVVCFLQLFLSSAPIMQRVNKTRLQSKQCIVCESYVRLVRRIRSGFYAYI